MPTPGLFTTFRRVPPRRLPTLLRRAALFLLAGLVTTVALCWIAAATMDLWPGGMSTARAEHMAPATITPPPQVAFVSIVEYRRTLGVGWQTLYATPGLYPVIEPSPPLRLPVWADPILRPSATIHDGVPRLDERNWPATFTFPRLPYAITVADVRAYGWPTLALYRVVRIPGFDPVAGTPIRVGEGELTLDGTRSPDRRALPGPIILPYRIVPLGLAVDTTTFAAAWWALAASITFLRARRRVARGQCPRCGYARDGLDPAAPCPECGAATRQR